MSYLPASRRSLAVESSARFARSRQFQWPCDGKIWESHPRRISRNIGSKPWPRVWQRIQPTVLKTRANWRPGFAINRRPALDAFQRPKPSPMSRWHPRRRRRRRHPRHPDQQYHHRPRQFHQLLNPGRARNMRKHLLLSALLVLFSFSYWWPSCFAVARRTFEPRSRPEA